MQLVRLRYLIACASRCARAARRQSAALLSSRRTLSPPLQPLRPGGYDFARDMYFQKIGASGYALGAIRVKAPPAAAGFWLRYATIVDGIREAIDDRIRAALPGDSGSIASALITGKRDAISTPINDAMYVSSLAHVLSISGYHMAVVAGIVFFVIRAVLALIPSLAHRQADQEMGGIGSAAGGDLLSSAVGRRGGDPALLHHDRDRAYRRHARSSDADVPHARGGGHRRFAAGAAGHRASEVPDVVCSDAGAHRRLSARPSMEARP